MMMIRMMITIRMVRWRGMELILVLAPVLVLVLNGSPFCVARVRRRGIVARPMMVVAGYLGWRRITLP
jgi:hypothetical protein